LALSGKLRWEDVAFSWDALYLILMASLLLLLAMFTVFTRLWFMLRAGGVPRGGLTLFGSDPSERALQHILVGAAGGDAVKLGLCPARRAQKGQGGERGHGLASKPAVPSCSQKRPECPDVSDSCPSGKHV
jgi:hypothetical protein